MKIHKELKSQKLLRFTIKKKETYFSLIFGFYPEIVDKLTIWVKMNKKLSSYLEK